MRKAVELIITASIASAITGYPSVALAAEKVEGTVVGTKLTACDFANKRCEGYLTLEPKTATKAEPMSIRILSATSLSKANEKVLLPSLRGSVVTVNYVKEKGENLAKSVEVVQTKK